MSVRIRRLQGDRDLIDRTFGTGGRIRIRETRGRPPDRYLVEYLVTGLEQRPDGTIARRESHLVQVTLTLAYPRQAPQCRMLTPVFHPNIAPHAVCVGDHWAAGESLAHLLVRIGEMITYQSYNVQSPLNGEAARWAERNRSELPVDPVDLAAFHDAPDAPAPPEGPACANCGARSAVSPCARGHDSCPDCRYGCPGCDRDICLACTTAECSRCSFTLCSECVLTCANCAARVCDDHGARCAACEVSCCRDCGDGCPSCSRFLCLAHLSACGCAAPTGSGDRGPA